MLKEMRKISFGYYESIENSDVTLPQQVKEGFLEKETFGCIINKYVSLSTLLVNQVKRGRKSFYIEGKMQPHLYKPMKIAMTLDYMEKLSDK